MRDAELRFATLRMRIVERTPTARGEDAVTASTSLLRHPGDAKVTTSRAGHGVEGRLRDLDLRRRPRADVRRRPQARHAAPDPQPAARPRRPRLPGHVEGLRAGHGPADGDAAGHVRPPGRLLPERRSPPAAARSPARDVVSGREAILLECDHPRTTELAGDRPDFHISIAVDRETGVILRLVEIDRRRRSPATPRSSTSARTRRCRRRRSSSSSPPGRRCSTEPAALPSASAERV